MSKRDIVVFLVGIACGGIAVGTLMLRIRPLVQVELATTELAETQRRHNLAPSEHRKLSYALGGYCPVTLLEQWEWKLGNIQFAETRDNQVYLFASSDAQHRFQQDPDRYIPAFSGNDVVLAIDSGETTRGKREHGITYEGRIYLFATEESLDRFSQSPKLYAIVNDSALVAADQPNSANSAE